MSVNIRLASSEDIDNLVKVRFDYFAAENWEVSPEPRQIIENNLRQYYSKYLNDNFFAAFAEVDSKIVSAAFLAISNMPANLSFPTGRTGTILNVLTYPEHRKKGYAAAAMNLLLDEARRRNLSYVGLSASEPAKSLYQKLGFKESGPSGRFTEMRLSLL